MKTWFVWRQLTPHKMLQVNAVPYDFGAKMNSIGCVLLTRDDYAFNSIIILEALSSQRNEVSTLFYFRADSLVIRIENYELGQAAFCIKMWRKLKNMSGLELVWVSVSLFKYVNNSESKSISILVFFNSFDSLNLFCHISSLFYLCFSVTSCHQYTKKTRIIKHFSTAIEISNTHVAKKNI